MSTYQNKYVSDIILKRPNETFVDDPGSLSEVNVPELVFDLKNNIKDINNLHVFHAVAILRQVVEDLIVLGSDPEKCASFRKSQLLLNSIDLEDLQQQVHDREAKNERAKSEQLDGEITEHSQNGGESSPLNIPEGVPGGYHNDNQPQQGSGDVQICMQKLVSSTSLEKAQSPISQMCNERLRKEVMFHMSSQVQKQAVHLVRNFSLTKEPPISIEEFLVRIHTYSPSISVAVYIHSAYMLYKLCVVLGVVTLTPLNVHRFVLASLRCSTKKLEDVYQKQKSFATVGGLELRDLCRIEVSFLYLFNFQVVVSEALLNDFLASGFVALHAAAGGSSDLGNDELGK